MRKWFWIVLGGCVALAGYLVWSLAAGPRARGKSASAPFEVDADSVVVYEQRVAELEIQVDNLKKRMVAAGTAERREVKARLVQFEVQMSDLKRAIAKWRVARGGDAPNEAYRQCLLLYGKARGVCEALAPDTLSGK